MEDKRFKVINVIFLIVCIIYLLYSFTFDIYSENIILEIGTRLYHIGFIAFVICQMCNRKKEVSLKVFSILTVISVISTIYQCISTMSSIKYIISFIDICLIITASVQKIILAIFLILNRKQVKNKIRGYILLVVTFILNIIMLCQEVTLYNCLLSVVSIYMVSYMFYFNKGYSKYSFRNIILLIVITLLIILSFIFSETFLPKMKYNKVVQELEQINLVDSNNINTMTRNIKYNNINKISYKVSQKMEETSIDESINRYKYNDNIKITIYTSTSSRELDYEIANNSKNSTVNNRKFYIIPAKSYDAIVIYTEVLNNIYFIIVIEFEDRVLLNEEDLQNLKPLFYINV